MKLIFTERADEELDLLEHDKSKKAILKAVYKTLACMQHDLRHPSLNTHEFTSLRGPEGEKVFEAYAQQNTPGAYRIFWFYGPGKGEITIAAIAAHPNKKTFK